MRTLSLGRMKRLGIAAAALLFLLITRQTWAHPIPFSYLDLHIHADAIEGTLIAHNFDIAHDLNLDPPERLLDPAIVTREADAIIRLVAGRIEIAADGRVLSPEWSAPELVAD